MIQQKVTDIFLVFDYERQDASFNAHDIEKMLCFFSNSTENGQLYINYPMIESYKHFNQKPLPDLDYLKRVFQCSELTSKENRKNKYKEVVGQESQFKDLRKIWKEDFCQFVIHNLCKAAYITRGTADISQETAYNYWNERDMLAVLKKQNNCSSNLTDGFVYVLCTCLFFIPEYNSNLIFGAECTGK